MNTKERREAIGRLIAGQGGPVTGAQLAERYGVSRQVIVQDIAVLRAAGQNIIATPAGYMAFPMARRAVRVVACSHRDSQDLRRELYIMVDGGALVRDVIVEHPVYGEMTAQLMLSTRAQADALADALTRENARPLSSITGGVHLHTLEAEDEQTLDRVVDALRAAGILRDGGD